MCCIITKPAGVNMPSKAILNKIANRNRDGFGLCTSNGKYIRTTDREAFFKALEAVTAEESCIIHMRLATHGSNKETNCHPFYDADTQTFFAHNGILPVSPSGDITDSEFVFTRCFAPAIKECGFDSRETYATIRSWLDGQRFAFMRDGKITRFGRWFELEDGCCYSNLHWTIGR